MNEVPVARGPIFDRWLEAVGYELLFGAGHVNTAVVSDDEDATATVVLNSFTEVGLERMGRAADVLLRCPGGTRAKPADRGLNPAPWRLRM